MLAGVLNTNRHRTGQCRLEVFSLFINIIVITTGIISIYIINISNASIVSIRIS